MIHVCFKRANFYGKSFFLLFLQGRLHAYATYDFSTYDAVSLDDQQK